MTTGTTCQACYYFTSFQRILYRTPQGKQCVYCAFDIEPPADPGQRAQFELNPDMGKVAAALAQKKETSGRPPED